MEERDDKILTIDDKIKSGVNKLNEYADMMNEGIDDLNETASKINKRVQDVNKAAEFVSKGMKILSFYSPNNSENRKAMYEETELWGAMRKSMEKKFYTLWSCIILITAVICIWVI